MLLVPPLNSLYYGLTSLNLLQPVATSYSPASTEQFPLSQP